MSTELAQALDTIEKLEPTQSLQTKKFEDPLVKYGVKAYKMTEIFCDDTFNCRGQISPLDVLDLAKSIERDGLDMPITIQPYVHPGFPQHKYRILAGHRRYTAFKVLNATEIPAFLRTDITEDSARLQNLRENIQREQLNMKQEAQGLKYFFDSKNSTTGRAHFTDLELATLFGQSRGWVQNRRDLLELPEELQDLAASGLFTTAHVKQLVKYKNQPEKQAELVRLIKGKREAGEKTIVAPSIKNAQNAYRVKERTRGEIMELNMLLYDMIGPSLITRYGAWCAGEISAVAFFADLKEHCKKIGKPYVEPEWIKAAIAGTFSKPSEALV